MGTFDRLSFLLFYADILLDMNANHSRYSVKGLLMPGWVINVSSYL